jgi:hypothetical protein
MSINGGIGGASAMHTFAERRRLNGDDDGNGGGNGHGSGGGGIVGGTGAGNIGGVIADADRRRYYASEEKKYHAATVAAANTNAVQYEIANAHTSSTTTAARGDLLHHSTHNTFASPEQQLRANGDAIAALTDRVAAAQAGAARAKQVLMYHGANGGNSNANNANHSINGGNDSAAAAAAASAAADARASLSAAESLHLRLLASRQLSSQLTHAVVRKRVFSLVLYLVCCLHSCLLYLHVRRRNNCRRN